MSMTMTEVFAPSHALEVMVRGTLVYLGLFVLLRLVLNRRAQGMSTPDVLLIVLIADAVQNGMAGEYKSITDGLILVATLLFWDFTLDWLAFRWPALERVIRQPPLLLVEDGRLNRHNMRRELVTLDELMSLLREHGIVDVSQVGRAWLEDDGKLSVVSIRQ